MVPNTPGEIIGHKNAERIICVNDPYDQRCTIKDSECMLRQKRSSISNIYMKLEDKFPVIKDFHFLLGKAENKIRLQAFLQAGFQSTADTSAVENLLLYRLQCEKLLYSSDCTTVRLFPCRS